MKVYYASLGNISIVVVSISFFKPFVFLHISDVLVLLSYVMQLNRLTYVKPSLLNGMQHRGIMISMTMAGCKERYHCQL